MAPTSQQPSGRDPRAAPTDVRAVALIPARLASTRLPRKMLLADTGLPLVAHTAQNVRDSGIFARVVVAVDDDEIARAVREHGFEAVLTRVDHPSGTDRVREAWEALAARGEPADVLVGVQGDEPDLERDDLARLVAVFADPTVQMATLCVPIEDVAAFEARSVVKVVRDARGDALYFSRAPVPAAGHGQNPQQAHAGGMPVSAGAVPASAGAVPVSAGGMPVSAGAVPASAGAVQVYAGALRHVGVYAYRPSALARFTELPRGALEVRESLEQLRWLEAGLKLRVVDARRAPRGIDTRADYDEFVRRESGRRDLARRGGRGTGNEGGRARGGLAEARAG